MYLRELVQSLGAGRPVYGLESIQPDLRSKGFTPLSDLAATYIKEIRDCQPAGPYALLGHSNGGTIVYEIACQLRDLGEQVDFLGLLDTYPPGARIVVPFRERVLTFWQGLVDARGTRERVRYLRMRFQRSLVRLVEPTPLLGLFARAGLIPKDRMMISALAQVNYQPPYFDGTLTVFRVIERPPYEHSDSVAGWKAYVCRVELVDVPGNHRTVLSSPHVRELAGKIRERLESLPPA